MERKEVLNVLSDYKKQKGPEYGLKEIGLFGSYAKGTQTEQSDIDIYVRLSNSNLFILSRMRIDLEERLGKRVDVVQLRDQMNNYLKARIEKDAISA
jgi:predicted nucleotidyltransferase